MQDMTIDETLKDITEIIPMMLDGEVDWVVSDYVRKRLRFVQIEKTLKDAGIPFISRTNQILVAHGSSINIYVCMGTEDSRQFFSHHPDVLVVDTPGMSHGVLRSVENAFYADRLVAPKIILHVKEEENNGD